MTASRSRTSGTIPSCGAHSATTDARRVEGKIVSHDDDDAEVRMENIGSKLCSSEWSFDLTRRQMRATVEIVLK